MLNEFIKHCGALLKPQDYLVIGMIIGMILGLLLTNMDEVYYDDFEEDYHNCMAYHDGAGKLRLNLNGKLTLRCADGHKPSDPKHKHRTIRPFIRSGG